MSTSTVMNEPYVQTRVYMDTIVSIQLPGGANADVGNAVERAFGWFAEVERRCSRFDPESELRRLCARQGEAVQVSPLLFQAIEFALTVASATGGVFDPTLGRKLELRGFDRNYRTGETIASPATDPVADYRDIRLNRDGGTVTLLRPLALDLNAIAKGLAIDLAAAELHTMPSFLINAGGDILVRGHDVDGGAWAIGIKDPFEPTRLLSLISLEDGAVCTSGGYERPAKDGLGHHIVSPDLLEASQAAASVTVVAPSAMVADALSTAAFALGVEDGLSWLEEQQAAAMVIDQSGTIRTTPAFARYL